MEEEKKYEPEVDLVAEAERRMEKTQYQRQLRGLELRAYSGVLEALRASGKPNPEKDGLIKTLRDFFNISEDRHKSEIRLLAYDDKLSIISKKINGYDYSDDWAFLAQRMYVPFGPQAFSLYRSYPTNILRNCAVLKDPVPSGRSKDKDSVIYEDDSDDDSDVDLELIEKLVKENTVNGLQEKPKPYAIAVETGTGNEEEIEEMEALMKKRLKNQAKRQQFTPPKSPDITDTPNTPTKNNIDLNNEKLENVAPPKVRSRPGKRKNPEDSPSQVENSTVNRTKKLKEKSKNILKAKKPNRSQLKVKFAPPKKEIKKSKESSEETSSADEGENGPMPIHLEESSRVMSPVFSEVIRTSASASSAVARGGGRGKGGRGRGGVTDRRRNNASTSPTKAKGGKSRPKTPNQKSAKLKNSTPTSGSRRKSKLNEKLDYDDIAVNHEVVEQQWSPVSQYYDMRNNMDENSRRIYMDNQIQGYDGFRDTRITMKFEDYPAYSDSMPANYHTPEMEQVNDGVFKRPLPPSKGPKLWEIKDARLNHCYPDEQVSDENASGRGEGDDGEIGSPEAASHQNMINCTSDLPYGPSTPPKNGEQSPPSKKQRIKSPLIVNPNINPPNASKNPLPAPVFSTSLNKKRQNSKPMSVVDSLNLHLPTSATASSLAASSNNRRPSTASGGGCSMFSNSSALIAGARGTAPGILQQQRKATPHILSNSKVHQRTFLPTPVNPPSVPNCNVSIGSNIVPISGPPPAVVSLAPGALPVNSVAPGAHTVQIPASQIPISVTPSNSLPFPNFPSSNSASLTLSPAAVPIGQVNRSAAGGANIIFVQKTNGPAVGIGGAGSAVPVPSNVIPLKTSPRAVILRRAQIPRQGNVMILDVQKNQLVAAGQTSPILQTARVLNSPGELSLINMQPSTSPKSQTSPIVSANQTSPSSASTIQSFQPSQSQMQDTAQVVGSGDQQFVAISQAGSPQIIHLATSQLSASEQQNSNTVLLDGGMIGKLVPVSEQQGIVAQGQEVSQDAQYAQIEAELMQMEQGGFEEIVYEEEVTTEIVPLDDGGTTQYIYENDAIPTTEGELMLTPHNETAQNTLSVSGSSTDTASENETNLPVLESPESDVNKQTSITKVTLSPMGEAKIATEAISRALSLSKSSPSKKLTFTTSTSSEPTTTTTPSASSSESSINIDKSNIVYQVPSGTVSQALNVIPITFQTTDMSAKTSNVLLDGDLPSTNSTNAEVNSEETRKTEVEVVTNESLQSSQPELQDTPNPS